MPKIHFLPDDIEIEVEAGTSILTASLQAGLSHAHACGGVAQCSTCRVWVLDGKTETGMRSEAELALSRAISLDDHIRLACQTVPTGDVKVRRLVLDEDDIEITSQLDDTRSGFSGVQKNIAVMFADIRGFTSFCEPLPPYDVIFVLDRFFNQMGKVIYNHGGYIDNYMGDGFMALFGVDGAENATLQAVTAGEAMLAAVEEMKPYLHSTYQREFEIGIGIHFGPVVMGSLGYGESRKVATIGDTVNLASRIESLTKETAFSMLISQNAYQQVEAKVSAERIGDRFVKGKQQQVSLYGVKSIAETLSVEEAPTRLAESNTDAANWVKVCSTSVFDKKTKYITKVNQVSLMLVKTDTAIFAMESRCPHLRLPLKRAKVTDDCAIVCPWHHSAFNMKTGDVEAWAPWPPVIAPTIGKLQRQRALQTWETKVEDDHVWVTFA